MKPMSSKVDIVDLALTTFYREFQKIKRSQETGSTVVPYIPVEPDKIDPREWLYGDHLIRKFASLTVAAGGVGKSALAITDALSMVTGRDLIGSQPTTKLRVWYHGGEDPLVELQRRVAAAQIHFGISNEEIGDRLILTSGRDFPIKIAKSTSFGATIDLPTVIRIKEIIMKYKIDVLMLDPFVTIHEVQENDTTAMNAVVSELRAIADATNCAIEIIHHTSKAGAMDAKEFGIYASRGAGALIDGVRSARYLARMTEEQARKFDIETRDRRSCFLVTTGKANLAPMEDGRWMKTIGVPLNNGRSYWERGDIVGVCVAWSPPNVMETVTTADWNGVREAILSAAEPPTENERGFRWIGYTVASVMGLDIGAPQLKKEERTADQNANRSKVKRIVGSWLYEKKLTVEKIKDGRTGRDLSIIKVLDENGVPPQSN